MKNRTYPVYVFGAVMDIVAKNVADARRKIAEKYYKFGEYDSFEEARKDAEKFNPKIKAK